MGMLHDSEIYSVNSQVHSADRQRAKQKLSPPVTKHGDDHPSSSLLPVQPSPSPNILVLSFLLLALTEGRTYRFTHAGQVLYH